MVRATAEDEEMKDFIDDRPFFFYGHPTDTEKSNKKFLEMSKNYSLEDGILFYTHGASVAARKDWQVWVPHKLRYMTLAATHRCSLMAHPGINRMYQLLKKSHYWPNMKEDITNYVNSCPRVQKNQNSA
eukprot:gb/GEZN01023298.1/.p1 GENE.gb/GEZN01023298.1/~~gb/GEZN01023298.1/.p1  ORF type:complete len:129 (-),score=8.02 gb/GEZN01023298.1/:126-512(-)